MSYKVAHFLNGNLTQLISIKGGNEAKGVQVDSIECTSLSTVLPEVISNFNRFSIKMCRLVMSEAG